MAYERGVRADYTVGTITLVSGSKNFTTTGASLITATIGRGDTIMTADGRVLIINEITGQNSGTLLYPCPVGVGGTNLPLCIRFQSSASAAPAAIRDLIARWGMSGNIDALAGLKTLKDTLAFFTGSGTADVTALTEWARTLLAAANGGKGYASLGEIPNGQLPARLKANGGVAISDPNTVTENGWYRVSGNSPNMPETSTMLLLHAAWSSTQCRQIALRHSSNAMYERFRAAAGWSAWHRIYSSANILNSVSQVDGTPTGGVIQRGNNANGEFVRLADGTQICTQTIMAGVTTATVGPLFMTPGITWTFPASFVSRPVVVGSCYKVSGGGVTMLGGPLGNATATAVSNVRGVSTHVDSDTELFLVADGRWF
ncbi:pyocin knob domain-containing protein [Paenochrobactrum sp. BZR 588]|uniref:pyocin knob domain-containing protein n=1 Tax=unclassified Paenochrobactrum TaxID=2639760 RepID=UPI003852987A